MFGINVASQKCLPGGLRVFCACPHQCVYGVWIRAKYLHKCQNMLANFNKSSNTLLTVVTTIRGRIGIFFCACAVLCIFNSKYSRKNKQHRDMEFSVQGYGFISGILFNLLAR